jgi:hypothetical protein
LTRDKLIEACISGFVPNFAETWAEQVIATQSLPTLWGLIAANDRLELSKDHLEKFQFRSAYILETVYCRASYLFSPYLYPFFELFPKVTNGSMRRHFAKICLLAIREGNLPHNTESIAIACADWIIAPQTRVAVKVLALDILAEFAITEQWISELLSEVVATQTINPSAGMIVRLRKIKSIVKFI